MSKFWSPAVRSLVPYTPGEQPQILNLIKLNTNENPYPPAPGVFDVLKSFDAERLRLYPDPAATKLKQALSAHQNLPESHIFIGNGSDEVLALAFMAFFRQEQPLLMPEISYSFYEVYCGLYEIDFKKLPLNENFEVAIEQYQQPNGGVIIANPNAPTGRTLALSEIEALLQNNTETVVLVDEAYVDFGGETAANLVTRYPNLLVVQTFSKSRSLAGMRVGFAYGSPELIEALERVKNSFNSYPLDMLAIETATAALNDKAYFEQTCAKIMQTRTRTTAELEALGFNVIPSATNFVFATHKSIPAAELMQFLRDNKILVRHFSKPIIQNYLRISIGTDAEMDALISTLKQHPAMS